MIFIAMLKSYISFSCIITKVCGLRFDRIIFLDKWYKNNETCHDNMTGYEHLEFQV